MPSAETTQAGEDFDNPWESAANDDVYRSTSLRVEERVAAAAEEAATSPSEDQSRSFKNRCIRCNQILDGMLSALFIVFSFFLYHKHKADSNTTQLDMLTITLLIFFVTLAFILLLRSVLGRRFFHFNMNSRPVLVLTYLVTACVLFVDAKHLPAWILKLELEKKEGLPIVLLSLAVLEVVLFCFLRHCHLSELEDIQDAENLNRYTNSRAGRSPWWWSNHRTGRRENGDEDLEEPLLYGQPSWTNASRSYQVRDGVGTSSSSSWWPFSRGSAGSNARDDGSVDYASLNEDWASRSEADPYWWSRDDDGN